MFIVNTCAPISNSEPSTEAPESPRAATHCGASGREFAIVIGAAARKLRTVFSEKATIRQGVIQFGVAVAGRDEVLDWVLLAIAGQQHSWQKSRLDSPAEFPNGTPG